MRASIYFVLLLPCLALRLNQLPQVDVNFAASDSDLEGEHFFSLDEDSVREESPPSPSHKLSQEEKDGMPNAPPEGEWESRLKDILERGAKDPCKADIVNTGFQALGHAFGSNGLFFLNQVTLALYFNRSLSLRETAYGNEVWGKYFQDPGIASCKTGSRKAVKLAWEGNHLSRALFRTKGPEYLFNMKRFLHSKFYSFKEEHHAKFMSLVSQDGSSQSDNYIGVHIRHGDKGKESARYGMSGLLPASAYAKAVIKQSIPSDKLVYVASDDGKAANDLQKALDAHKVSLRAVLGSKPDEVCRSYTNEKCMDALMKDIFALKHARVFIGTGWTNLGLMVMYSRPQKLTSLAIDAPWGTKWDWL